jgi:thiamine biosynthesis lipoprotein
MAMGCAYSIVTFGPDAEKLRAIVDDAFAEIGRIDRLMSHYDPESPLSRLNREAARGPVPVEAELFDFLAECLRQSRDSDGAFDVTVGPLVRAWGFFRGEGRLPPPAEIEGLRRRVGYRHVALDPERRTVRFARPGMELDLGGIAKGYAVDRVVALLRERGVGAALVSAGGSSVYGLGAPPGQAAWEVRVQDPLHPSRDAFTVALRDLSLSVSGSSYKSFAVGGRTYSHIMDPRSGRPAEGILSVAVLSLSATVGDALDNALFVEGVAKARRHVARLPSTLAFIFLPDGEGRFRVVRLGGRDGARGTRLYSPWGGETVRSTAAYSRKPGRENSVAPSFTTIASRGRAGSSGSRTAPTP